MARSRCAATAGRIVGGADTGALAVLGAYCRSIAISEVGATTRTITALAFVVCTVGGDAVAVDSGAVIFTGSAAIAGARATTYRTIDAPIARVCLSLADATTPIRRVNFLTRLAAAAGAVACGVATYAVATKATRAVRRFGAGCT